MSESGWAGGGRVDSQGKLFLHPPLRVNFPLLCDNSPATANVDLEAPTSGPPGIFSGNRSVKGIPHSEKK